MGVTGIALAFAQEMHPRAYRDAAVDSELALLWQGNYETAGSQPNPLFWRTSGRPAEFKPFELLHGVTAPAVLMTARIDGPTAADARRIIEDSIAVEMDGLD